MHNVYEDLGEPSRRLILIALRSGPKNVGEIVAATGLKQPNVSNHLARMRQRGVVQSAPVGRKVYYSLATMEVESALRSALEIEEHAPEPVDLESMVRPFARAAVAGDESECVRLIDTALRAGTGNLDIYECLLGPVMGFVGTWHQVEAIDVAQEHMASSIMERMLARVVAAFGPLRQMDRSAVIGCAPNAHHTIALRMVNDYLHYRGWSTLYLGANVPESCFVDTVRRTQPALVLTNCSSLAEKDGTLSLIRAIKAVCPGFGCRIGVGGYCVRMDAQPFLDAGADFVVESLREFSERQLPCVERGETPAPSV